MKINMKKFVMSSITTVIGSWLGYKIISFILVFLLQNVFLNIYLIYAASFFLPLIIILGLSIYFFIHKEKEIAVAVFIAGIMSCSIFGYGILFTIGEMGL